MPQQALATKLKKIIPFLVGGLVVLSCLVVFLIGRSVERENVALRQSVASLEKRQQMLQSQQATIAQLTAKLEGMAVQEKGLRKKVANISDIPHKKQRFSELLIEIAKVMASSIRCQRITLEERNGEIQGIATAYKDLPKFVKELNTLPRFNSVSLHVLNQSERQDIELMSFTILFQLQRKR